MAQTVPSIIQLEIGEFFAGWKIDKKLGQGAFGVVFKCSKEGKHYALKVSSNLILYKCWYLQRLLYYLYV